MGVPVISLIGNTFLSRAGYSLLSAAGLAQFAAADEREYVSIAVRWAQDLSGLAGLRNGMRDQLVASPLCDAARFTANLEGAYRSMWKTWCEKQ
jgi:predicted O-linked N-acetylglucosamine transferase (SPINDLY family)